MDKTPIQDVIARVKLLEEFSNHPVEKGMISIMLTMLNNILPKEKEFVGEVFDAGWKSGYRKAQGSADGFSKEYILDKQQSLSQYYPDTK